MMRYHHQNLSYDKLPLWRHGRAWWGGFAWEWHLFEDSHLTMASCSRWGFSAYMRWFTISLHWRDDDSYDRGEWQVSWNDGSLWLKHPWVRQNEWRSADPWWRKDIVLNINDWLLGPSRCEVTKGEPFDAYIPMPEGTYLAKARTETYVWTRRWYVPKRRRDSVWLDIEARGGIPRAGKGESSWDCGDDGLCGIGGDTLEQAVGNAVASALRDRRRYGHDSSGTGRVPLRVIAPEVSP